MKHFLLKRFVFVTLFLIAFLAITLRPASAAAPQVKSIAVPSSVDIGEDISIQATGEGKGDKGESVDIILRVASDADTEPAFNFIVGDDCKPKFRSSTYYKDFSCEITDASGPSWSLSVTRTNDFKEGTYKVYFRDNSNGQMLNEKTFTVGAGSPTITPGLTVSISPPGPFDNNTFHNITITWQEAIPSKYYRIESDKNRLFNPKRKQCLQKTCSETATIQVATAAGANEIKVYQENDPTVFGTATVTINSLIAPGGDDPTEGIIFKFDKEKRRCTQHYEALTDSSEQWETEYGCIVANQAFLVPSPTPTPGLAPCDQWVDFGYTKSNGSNATGKRCESVATGLGIVINTTPGGAIKTIFGLILSISGGIALLIIIYAGYQIMTSQGNQEKLQAARETITSAVIGLLFIIFSLVILQVIGLDILRIPGFTTQSAPCEPGKPC